MAPLMAQRGDARAAIYHYRQAFQLNPKDLNSKNDLAAILWRLGKWEAALAALCQVVIANSKHYEANVNLAAVYFSKGEYDLALKHGRRAVELRPSNPLGHRVLGQIFDHTGNSSMSLHHHKIAVRRGPGAAGADAGEQGGVFHQQDTQTYKKVGAQLVTGGEEERENSHHFTDCYRAMQGKRVVLANSERTYEILTKCLR